MTTDPGRNRPRELSWRRKLTEAETAEVRAWLEAHPEGRADFEAESALNAALESLSSAPVSSNFTQRVLQSVALETATQARAREPKRGWWRFRLQWLPKAALAALVLGAGAGLFGHIHRAREREAYVESLLAVSRIETLPSAEILEDFDAIRALNPTRPDTDLLALFE